MSYRLILLVLLVALAGCESDQPSLQTSQTTQDKPSESGGIAESILGSAGIEDVGEAAVPIPDSPEDLMEFLARLRTSEANAKDIKQMYQIQRRRADASAKLLTHTLNNEQHFEAVKIRLDSLLKLVLMRDIKAGVELPEFFGKKAKHGDKRVVEAVAVAGLVNELYTQEIADSPNLQPLLVASREVANSHPESFDVCKEISNIGDRLLQQGDRENWKKISSILVEVYQNSSNQQAQGFARHLASRLRVADSNLDVIVNQIKEQTPGAFDQYREVVNQVLNDPNLETSMVDTIIGSLRWLENATSSETAMEANRVVQAASIAMAQGAYREQLQRNCDQRIIRLASIGQPFSIATLDERGQPFDLTTFQENRPTLVLFWDQNAVPVLREVLQQVSRVNGKLKLVAVNCTDQKLHASLDIDFPAHTAKVTPQQTIAELSQTIGNETLPHMVVLDGQGQVIRINPPFNQFSSMLTELANQ